jgi:hypothetical protein
MRKLFPARESLVSDIPAVDGKTVNFFYSVDGIFVPCKGPTHEIFVAEFFT